MARWVFVSVFGSSSLSSGLSIAGSTRVVWSKLHTDRIEAEPAKNPSFWIKRTYISSRLSEGLRFPAARGEYECFHYSPG